jgi:multisubunit Na+/H+ antiporter MnhE subunit
VLWLAFANNAGRREILIGAVASAIATVAVAIFLHHTRDRFILRTRYLYQIVHAPQIVFSGTWILLRAIALRLRGRNVPGGVVAVHFRIGGDTTSSRGRRALAVTFLTLAPNNLVLGLLPDKELFLFHTVIPQPLPSFMFRLGAELAGKK